MDRRRFLELTGLGAVGALSTGLAGCSVAANQDASSTTSSSVAAASPWTGKLGVQLYTLRTLFQPDFRGTLEALAAIGFKDLEFAGLYDHDVNEVRAVMDDLGLVSNSTHVQLADMRDNLGAVIETASVLGQTNLIIPWMAPELRTVDGYKELAALLNTRGPEAKAAGMKVAYHNHEFEFEDLGGTTGYDILLNETDPDLVAMEIDFFWTTVAGIDPVALFEAHPGRFVACHIKDRTEGGDMVAVGDGVIDFASLLSHAETAGLKHFYVEHDQPEDPLVSVTRSYTHLAS